MPTAGALPDLLVDRSLGRRAVPDFLRGAWPATVRTLDDVFGEAPVPDTEWMLLADEEGWIAVCKDRRIRHRLGERQRMSQGTLRVFCLVNGQLTSLQQVERFRGVLDQMKRQALEPGPWMCGIYSGEIRTLTLYD